MTLKIFYICVSQNINASLMKKYFSWMKRRRWGWALPKGYHSGLPNKGNNTFYSYNTIFNLKVLFIFFFQFPLALAPVMFFTSQFIRFTSILFNHKLIFCLFTRTFRILCLCKCRTQLQKTVAPTNMLHGTSSYWIRAFFRNAFFSVICTFTASGSGVTFSSSLSV